MCDSNSSGWINFTCTKRGPLKRFYRVWCEKNPSSEPYWTSFPNWIGKLWARPHHPTRVHNLTDAPVSERKHILSSTCQNLAGEWKIFCKDQISSIINSLESTSTAQAHVDAMWISTYLWPHSVFKFHNKRTGCSWRSTILSQVRQPEWQKSQGFKDLYLFHSVGLWFYLGVTKGERRRGGGRKRGIRSHD